MGSKSEAELVTQISIQEFAKDGMESDVEATF